MPLRTRGSGVVLEMGEVLMGVNFKDITLRRLALPGAAG